MGGEKDQDESLSNRKQNNLRKTHECLFLNHSTEKIIQMICTLKDCKMHM